MSEATKRRCRPPRRGWVPISPAQRASSAAGSSAAFSQREKEGFLKERKGFFKVPLRKGGVSFQEFFGGVRIFVVSSGLGFQVGFSVLRGSGMIKNVFQDGAILTLPLLLLPL